MGKRPVAAALALCAGLGLGVALTYLAVRKRDEPKPPAPAVADEKELFPQRPYSKPVYRRRELLTKRIEPSADPVRVSHGEALTVEVPGGLLKEAQTLTVTELASESDDEPSLPKALARYDITLGSLKAFDRDVTLEFGYDAGVKTEQLAVCCWSERREAWERVPFDVDEARHRLVVRTRHLSEWEVDQKVVYGQCGPRTVITGWLKKSVTKKAWTPAEADATITFWMRDGEEATAVVEDPELIRRNAGNPRLKQRGGPTTRALLPSGDVVSTYFEMVWERYHALKFRLPTAIDVYLTLEQGESPSYSSFKGVIYLPRGADDLVELKANLAHELFHVVQNQYINGTSMFYMRAWWMDATADYAAGRVAWPGDAAVWASTIQFLKPHYLEQSITYFNEVRLDGDAPTVGESDARKCDVDRFHNHHYQTCIFVDYLVRKSGVDFHAMVEETLTAWGSNAVAPLEAYLKKTLGTARGLYTEYRDFAVHYLLASDSPIPAGGADTTVGASMDRLDALDKATPREEWGVTLEPLCSAKCWEIRASRGYGEAEVTVRLEEKAGQTWAGVRVFKLKGRRRTADPEASPVAILEPATGDPPIVSLKPGDGLYVVAYNAGRERATFKLSATLRFAAIRRPFSAVEKGVIGHEYAFGVVKHDVPDDATFRWAFSDGGGGSGEKAAHTYSSEGTYKVKLEATWSGGSCVDEAVVEIAADTGGTPQEVSFCVWKRYQPQGTDPTTGRPWKKAQYTCQEFTVEVFKDGVPMGSKSSYQSNGVATMHLPPGAYTFSVAYRYTKPEEDMGKQGGSFRVVDEGVTVDVETKSNF